MRRNEITSRIFDFLAAIVLFMMMTAMLLVMMYVNVWLMRQLGLPFF